MKKAKKTIGLGRGSLESERIARRIFGPDRLYNVSRRVLSDTPCTIHPHLRGWRTWHGPESDTTYQCLECQRELGVLGKYNPTPYHEFVREESKR